MSVNTIKTLSLTLTDGTTDLETVECQLTRAALIDSPTTEELTTFCGTESSSIANYGLEIAGFQDYGHESGTPSVTDSVFDILHLSYMSYQDDDVPDLPLSAVLTVGGKTRSFDCKPINDVPFGGDAGAALTGDITLDVLGDVTDGTAG